MAAAIVETAAGLPPELCGQDATTETPSLTAAQWREDLDAMVGLLTRLHPNPFHTTSRSVLEAETNELRAASAQLQDHEIMVRMARLAASIGDGHTRLNLRPGAPGVPSDPEAGFVRLPVRLEWLADGLYVRSASADLASLVGGRVLEIGDLSSRDAIDRVLPVVHGDNDMTRRLLVPGFLTTPAVLRATGAVHAPGPVRIVVEAADGRTLERQVSPSPEADPGAVDAAVPAPPAEVAWWRQSRGRPYWFEELPGARAVYVQLNASRPHDEEPMPEFVARLGTLLEGGGIDRVVLDLRRNDGGDSELTRPLVALLAGWEGASPDHGLFVLIGRATFSAAVVLAAELERFTGAIHVGEPTGGRPNQFGEIETLLLPNSGLSISYASWYFQTSDPWDARPWVTPDLAVEESFEDLRSGRDPALEVALSHARAEAPLQARLIELARASGAGAAIEEYRRFRAAPEHRYADTERALTDLMIDFWRRGEVAASLPIALLVVEEYPRSFEAHENLAEIHADQGNPAEAVRHAIESLRLHPGNGDALGVLREVCGQEVISRFLASDPTTAGWEAVPARDCPPPGF